jgi:hypothetical protein
MQYDFTLDDTLRPTEVTDFPPENLDSLQVPVYDTLRVDGSLLVPDSLVERRDTTVVEVVGVDTTVTRDGYLLYSTRRDTNAFRGAEEAVRELYVPDSVKARARLDSLIAQGVDTSRVTQPDSVIEREPRRDLPPLRVVPRTDQRTLDSLVLDDGLVRLFRYGIPRPDLSIDSLKLLSDSSLAQTLGSPELALRGRNRYVPRPDSVLRTYSADSLGTYLERLVRDSVVVDSLIRTPDTTAADTMAVDSMAVDSMAVDTMAADTMAADTLQTPADTVRTDTTDGPDGDAAVPDTTDGDAAVPDTTGADTLDTGDADTVAADTVAADTVAADTVAADSITADTTAAAAADTTRPSAKYLVSDTLTVGELFPDTLPSDSVRAYLERAGVQTDSIVVDSTTASFLTAPPPGTYYYVPTEKTLTNERVMVIDPVFGRLRSPAVLDSARVEKLVSLVPKRVGEPPEPTINRVVQQIILVPTGGYRTKYLETWARVQQANLRDHYCEIFRIPLQSPWRSTTTR